MIHKGSCLCGKVTFEIEGNFEQFFLCHCERCRKDTGSAHAANLFASKASIKWLSGQSNITTYNHNAEGHIKSFCATCGSALPRQETDGSRLVAPAGCLDTPVTITPLAHIYFSHRANWDNKLENVPKYEELPNK